MRLIDADALKERILKERDEIPTTIVERYSLGVPTPNKHGNSMRGGIRIALRCMEQTPTIDAEPVKNGRWVYKPYEKDEAVWLYHCSECNAVSAQAWNYCRECGAKMDLEVTNG